jgi:hypothetical protein
MGLPGFASDWVVCRIIESCQPYGRLVLAILARARTYSSAIEVKQ